MLQVHGLCPADAQNEHQQSYDCDRIDNNNNNNNNNNDNNKDVKLNVLYG